MSDTTDRGYDDGLYQEKYGESPLQSVLERLCSMFTRPVPCSVCNRTGGHDTETHRQYALGLGLSGDIRGAEQHLAMVEERLEPASELRDEEWPHCYERCSTVRRLGAGECENVCRWRFDSDGRSYLPSNLEKG